MIEPFQQICFGNLSADGQISFLLQFGVQLPNNLIGTIIAHAKQLLYLRCTDQFHLFTAFPYQLMLYRPVPRLIRLYADIALDLIGAFLALICKICYISHIQTFTC